MNFNVFGVVAAAVVGTILLVTSLMKVAAPFSFYRHVARLGFKLSIARAIVPFAIGVETSWAAALLVRLVPEVILPLTAIGFVFLTSLTWWSIKSGKTEDCGCYGGFITPSIVQTLALNGSYLALVGVAWALLPAETIIPVWKIAAVILAGILSGSIAEYALRFEFRTGVSRFTPSPLKPGARWKSSWGGSAALETAASQLVIYLGADCPYCQSWVRVLNIIHESAELPPVVGIMGSSAEKIEDFTRQTGVRFPIATIPEARMQRLASVLPTTVLVEHEIIQDVWGGAQLSEGFAQRFKAAFFPSVARDQGFWQLPLNSVEHVPAVLPPILQQ